MNFSARAQPVSPSQPHPGFRRITSEAPEAGVKPRTRGFLLPAEQSVRRLDPGLRMNNKESMSK